MEEVFIFKAHPSNGTYGFTRESNGENLPSSINDTNVIWNFFRKITIKEDEVPRIAIDTEEMLKAINEHGFYLNQVSIQVKEQP